MNVRIGSAPAAWGVCMPDDAQQPPWRQFLDEVGEAGYEWIELGPYGYLPTDLPTLQTEITGRGLKLSGGFVMRHFEDAGEWPVIEKELNTVGTILASFGSRYLMLIDDTYTDVATGESLRSGHLTDDEWRRLIETTHKVADLAKERFGLELVFHPHAETHVEYEDQIEAFLEQTDPERIFLCLDTGHHSYRGGDAVAFLRKHHARIRYFHFKNVDPEIREQVEREGIAFAPAVTKGMFCELSQGAVDFSALKDVLEAVDFDGWATVEQDMYPAPFDKPLPIAKKNRAFLREIGIG